MKGTMGIIKISAVAVIMLLLVAFFQNRNDTETANTANTEAVATETEATTTRAGSETESSTVAETEETTAESTADTDTDAETASASDTAIEIATSTDILFNGKSIYDGEMTVSDISDITVTVKPVDGTTSVKIIVSTKIDDSVDDNVESNWQTATQILINENGNWTSKLDLSAFSGQSVMMQFMVNGIEQVAYLLSIY